MERSVGQKHPQFGRFAEKPKITELFPRKSPIIYKLLGVSAKENDNLRVLDEAPDDNLILVHYLEPTSEVDHIRGIIIDVEREIVVAESFPFTQEHLPTSDEVKSIPLGPDCEVTKAYEGTILRVFRGNVTGNWYLSTHRKSNGHRSRWAGPTFGEMFREIWGEKEDYDIYLAPKNCYVFLLSHGENRLVCHIPIPCIHHVQTFTPGPQGQMVSVPRAKSFLKDHPNVKPQEVLPITTTEALVKEANSLRWEECSGLLITQYSEGVPKGHDSEGVPKGHDSEGRTIKNCWKLIPIEYHERRNIRGNEPNFRFRYLQLMKELGGQGTKQIRELFPEKKDLFDKVDQQLNEVPRFLEGLYRERYFEKNFVYLPREIHVTLENTRSSYDPQNSLEENLRENMGTSDARQLNAMIRFMLQDQTASQETSSPSRKEN